MIEQLAACPHYFSETPRASPRQTLCQIRQCVAFLLLLLAGQYREALQKYYQEKMFIHFKTKVELNPREMTRFVKRNNRDFPPIFIITKTHL